MLSLRIATLLNVCTLIYWETYGTPSIRYEHTNDSTFWNVRSWGNAFTGKSKEVSLVVNQQQVKELIFEVCSKLGDRYSSNDAVELVYNTGLVESRYEYIKQIGTGPAKSFWQVEPETAVDNCKNFIANRPELVEKVASILSYSNVTENDETDLRRALVQQPVSVSINARCDAFMNYGGGVLDDDCGGGVHQIDHSVLAVGYDTSAKDPYYIVKNSWSEDWGENGYVRMKIGVNIDCIACKAVYPKAGPTPSPKPAPELKCAPGTYDPSSVPTSCPKGSKCCCGKKKFWKPKECAATECCLEGQTCTDGKGCQSSSLA